MLGRHSSNPAGWEKNQLVTNNSLQKKWSPPTSLLLNFLRIWTFFFSPHPTGLIFSFYVPGLEREKSILISNPACQSTPVTCPNKTMSRRRAIIWQNQKESWASPVPWDMKKHVATFYRNIFSRLSFRKVICEQLAWQPRHTDLLMIWSSLEFKVSRDDRFYPWELFYFLDVLILPNVCIYCFSLH